MATSTYKFGIRRTQTAEFEVKAKDEDAAFIAAKEKWGETVTEDKQVMICNLSAAERVWRVVYPGPNEVDTAEEEK